MQHFREARASRNTNKGECCTFKGECNMLRGLALDIILKSSCRCSLLLGLLPAPLDWRTLQLEPSLFYIGYSACIHLLYVATIGLSGYYAYEQRYTPGDPVLKWTYTVTNVAKVVAALLLLEEIWCRRRSWMTDFTAYSHFMVRYQHFQHGNSDGDEEAAARQRIQTRLERCLIWKFVTALVSAFLSFDSFLRLQQHAELSYLPMVCANMLMSMLLLVAMNQFYYVLCQLYRQFAYVHVALRQLQLQILQLARLDTSTDAAAVMSHTLTERFGSLAAMHFDCYRLTQRILRSCQTASAAIMLRIFVTNVRIVHLVVWLIYRIENGDTWVTGGNSLLMIFFYWDAVLLMGVIEGVLATCNGTGQLLRECNDLLLQCPEYDGLTRALEQFAVDLKCHKLTYKVCGLFEFNKEASLRYFLTVFVQVTVLVQFDLKFRLNEDG